MLDLCTGTGCIPLLVANDFGSIAAPTPSLRIVGVDVSDKAIKLARHNLQRTRQRDPRPHGNRAEIQFTKADILLAPSEVGKDGIMSLKASLNSAHLPCTWDILISNPPYISPKEYWKTTMRSVRGFEPKLALVPPHTVGQTDVEQGDAFYKPLLKIARDVEAKIVLLEIADMEQAVRVVRMARNMDFFDGIEIWRDQPESFHPIHDPPMSVEANLRGIPILGQGNARSVLCYRGEGMQWLQRQSNCTRPLDDAI